MAVAMAMLAIWIEGENYRTAPAGLEMAAGPKAPASGGKTLYGGCLENKGNVVTYEFDLPADVADGRIIFRYARLHWKDTMKPAAVELALTGPGGEVKKELAFADTRGWGGAARDYRLLPVEAGPLKKGKHTLTLTSLANDNSVTIDGFFVAAKAFDVTDAELNRCCRIQISSDGYVGLAQPTMLVRQDLSKNLALAVRVFDGSQPVGTSYTMQPYSAGRARPLEPAEGGKEGTQLFNLADRADGKYSLEALYKKPDCAFRAAPILCGDFLSTLEPRTKALAAFTADREKQDGAKTDRFLADFQHIVAYLSANCGKLGGAAPDANSDSAFKKGLAALEGMENPDALIDNMRRALEQAEKITANLKAGKDAYDGMVGDIRRAYRSAADGNLVPYRVFLPDAYAKDAKVPFIYLLHGGGGDEDYYPDTEGGKIREVLNKRGYAAVAPKWHSRNRPAGDVLQLLELTLKEYPKIDSTRVYCTGVSMGGFGTYKLATEHPELFAAVCCVSGTGDVTKAEKLKDVPLQIFQGGADTVVPPAGAERVAARMKELGYVVDYRLFPKYGHNYHAEEYLNLSIDFFEKYTRKK